MASIEIRITTAAGWAITDRAFIDENVHVSGDQWEQAVSDVYNRVQSQLAARFSHLAFGDLATNGEAAAEQGLRVE